MKAQNLFPFINKQTEFYLSVSGPFLAMIIFNFPSPPTGALSVPVVNCKNSLFCSSVNEWTIYQNSLVRKKEISELTSVFSVTPLKAIKLWHFRSPTNLTNSQVTFKKTHHNIFTNHWDNQVEIRNITTIL